MVNFFVFFVYAGLFISLPFLSVLYDSSLLYGIWVVMTFINWVFSIDFAVRVFLGDHNNILEYVSINLFKKAWFSGGFLAGAGAIIAMGWGWDVIAIMLALSFCLRLVLSSAIEQYSLALNLMIRMSFVVVMLRTDVEKHSDVLSSRNREVLKTLREDKTLNHIYESGVKALAEHFRWRKVKGEPTNAN